MTVVVVCYLIAAGLLYFYNKPITLNELIAFANQYDQLEQRMLEIWLCLMACWIRMEVALGKPDARRTPWKKSREEELIYGINIMRVCAMCIS